MEQLVSGLVARAVTGDERAWAALVERYAPLLWSVCRRFGLGPVDAEDVAQVVWLRLLEHLPAVREPAALPGWLVTTTRRECLRQARSGQGRARREALQAQTDLEPRDEPAELVEEIDRAQRFDALRAGFGALGERCRQLLAVLLRDPAPGYAEIGAELGMPVGSIGPTRARCLENLRRAPEVAALLTAARQEVR